MIRAIALSLLCAAALPAAADTTEQVVAGFSENRIAITANFDGSQILVYGAVKRAEPIPTDAPLEVIITLEGPPETITVRKKARRYGIWVNTDSVAINRAPSFYAISTTAPLRQILSATEDLRNKISIPRAIRAIGATGMAQDAPSFIEALIRVREDAGLYRLNEGGVNLTQSTLFSSRITLPADLVEGRYQARIFLTRNGAVLDEHVASIEVRKEGLERWLYRLAKDQPLIYGLLSLFIAISAGWGASAAFRAFKR